MVHVHLIIQFDDLVIYEKTKDTLPSPNSYRHDMHADAIAG